MRYRCHQCFGVIEFEEIAHVDMYVDLCWIQCETCAAAFGPTCGQDRIVNAHPHGYFGCPLRMPEGKVLDFNGRRLHLGRGQ